MIERFIETRNYTKLLESVKHMDGARKTSSRRMGLGYGGYGVGKTYSLERVVAQTNALMFRCKEVWSEKSMLKTIAFEMGLDDSGSKAELFERILDEFNRKHRIVILDEIDKIIRKESLLEIWRDFHDNSSVVVYMIGMGGAEGLLRRNGHLYSRISDIVRFEENAIEDIAEFCNCADVVIEKDLIEYFSEHYPNLRAIDDIIEKIEKKAKLNGLKTVDFAIFKSMGIERDAASRKRSK